MFHSSRGGIQSRNFIRKTKPDNGECNTEEILGSMSIATYVKAREQTRSEVNQGLRCEDVLLLTSESWNVID